MGTTTSTGGWKELSKGAPESVGHGLSERVLRRTESLSASYATGGDTIDVPTSLGTLIAVRVLPEVKSNTDIVAWDGSTSTPKLKVYVSGTGTEATAASDQSGKSRVIELVYEA